MMPKKLKSIESGQAVVLVLLSLSVVLTIILFVLSRSITDVSLSTSQADSVRAFSAAEAGVETALITGIGANNVSIGNASYSVDIDNSSAHDFNYPIPMLSGDTMTLWFISHKEDGTLTCDSKYPACFTGDSIKICWGTPGTSSANSNTPAIELAVYYESTANDLSSIKIERANYDPNTSRIANNHFSSASTDACQINGVNYAFQATVSLSSLGGVNFNSNGLIMAKIRLIYNSSQAHQMGVSSLSNNVDFPSQGKKIISTGYSTSNEAGSGQSNRRISVFEGWSEFPLSGLVVFAPGGITK